MNHGFRFANLSRIVFAAVAVIAMGAASGLRAEVDIVYVSRDGEGLDAKRPGADTVAVRSGRGSLIFRAVGGEERVLVDGSAASDTIPADVMDPDVSWDGTRIVFSGYSTSEGAWRIYEINVNGTGLRQITRSDREIDLARYGEAAATLERYDDLDPCYLPDGRICLVSTRYPGIAPDNRARTTNLYVANADGSDLHRITTERFGGDTPAVDPETGNIVYSRWWRTPAGARSENGEPAPIEPGSPGYGGSTGGFISEFDEEVMLAVSDEEFPGVNSWFLASIRPDGGEMKMLTGFHLDRGATQAYRPAPSRDGTITALFIPETPHIGLPGRNGLRVYARGPSRPRALGGPQSFGELERIDADADGDGIPDIDPAGVPVDADGAASLTFYESAVPLGGLEFLVSARAPGSEDYDIFVQGEAVTLDPNGVVQPRFDAGLRPLVTRPGTHELDATPVVRRAVPPVVADADGARLVDRSPRTAEEAREIGGTFTFLVENIHFNAPIDVPVPNAPPIGQELSIEFWMSPPGSSLAAVDPPILLHSEPIGPDGRVEVELPAGVPLFEVLRLPRGEIARGRDGQIFHVAGMNFGREGGEGRCVGCHAGHSMLEVPDDPSWTNVAPSAFVTGSSLVDLARFPDEVPPELFDLFGGSLQPQRAVDRSTDPSSQWAANLSSEGTAQLDLDWDTPIQARSVTLIGAEPFPLLLPEFFEFNYTIELRLDGAVVRAIASDGRMVIPNERIEVTLDPEQPFDRLSVVLAVPDGAARIPEELANSGVSLLSEVEVIGRTAAADPGDTQRLIRGDTNADGTVNITDPIALLSYLFLADTSPACEAAADAERNGKLDVTDAVRTLGWLFTGLPRPEPFAACEDVPRSDLGCDVEICAD